MQRDYYGNAAFYSPNLIEDKAVGRKIVSQNRLVGESILKCLVTTEEIQCPFSFSTHELGVPLSRKTQTP